MRQQTHAYPGQSDRRCGWPMPCCLIEATLFRQRLPTRRYIVTTEYLPHVYPVAIALFRSIRGKPMQSLAAKRIATPSYRSRSVRSIYIKQIRSLVAIELRKCNRPINDIR